MRDKILKWFGTGRVGASSTAMALAAVGMPNDGSHPHDSADLNGCLLLLDAVPEIRQHMDKVAAMSDEWARLVARWGELERCFLDEAGFDGCKSKNACGTYNLMRTILHTD